MADPKSIMKQYGHKLLHRTLEPLATDVEPHVPLNTLVDVQDGRIPPHILQSYSHADGSCDICNANIQAFLKDRTEYQPACMRCNMIGMCEFDEDPTKCESLHICNTEEFRGLPCAMRGGFPTLFKDLEIEMPPCPCPDPDLADLSQLKPAWRSYPKIC